MAMVTLKTSKELAKMRKAGAIAAQALQAGGAAIRPGVTTGEVDRAIKRFIVSKGAKPSFLGYGGFPGSACISVNEEVIHGIPGKRILREGDIVSIDVGALYDGYHGDTAATFAVGAVDTQAQTLMDATRESLQAALAVMRVGARIGDIGSAVQSYVEERGFGVVHEYVGHGVGRNLHVAPEVPNYGAAGHGARFQPGMVIAVEPMVCAGDWQVRVLPDRWTTVSADGSLAAHYENTVLITDGEPELLTVDENGEPA